MLNMTVATIGIYIHLEEDITLVLASSLFTIQYRYITPYHTSSNTDTQLSIKEHVNITKRGKKVKRERYVQIWIERAWCKRK